MNDTDFRSQGMSLLERAFSARSGEWSKQLESTGESLAQIGDQLDTIGAAPAARLARTGADYATRFGQYLSTADVETLLHDAETFSRRQPLVVTVAGFALGLASARMLKAGSARRYERYGNRPTYASGTADLA